MATLIVVEDLAAPSGRGRGGQTIHTLQWLHGLKRLGHEVLFVEFYAKDPGDGREAMTRYFREVMEDWWDPQWSALLLERTGESLYGLDAAQVGRLGGRAAALLGMGARYGPQPFHLVTRVP